MNKLPPIEKIPEAYSAIVDERIALYENYAEMASSDHQKTYIVRWDGNMYSSNDSATYWQGYAGYPILAVLMLQGKLPLCREAAVCFKGVNWTALNKKLKRDYAKAVESVLDMRRKNGVDTDFVKNEIEKVYRRLPQLPIIVKRGSKK